MEPQNALSRTPREGMLESRMQRFVGLIVLALLAAACGRPATEQECDEIVARITELELKARGIAGNAAEEVQGTKDALRKTTLRDCVGRRISDKALICVRSATTADQIVRECF